MVGRAGTGLIPLPAARRRPLDAIDRRELRAGARGAHSRRRGRGVPRDRGGLLRAPRRGRGAAPPPGLGDLGGRPSFAGPPAASSIAILLLRRMAADRETIDLSVSPQ